MDLTPESVITHKHYHYHYHYDINDRYLHQQGERYSNSFMINSQKNLSTPYRRSWKNHINPEVTKLYEEISIHDSFDDQFTSRASRFSQRLRKKHLDTSNLAEHKRFPRSKTLILQDIRAYEQYLEIHSKPNLYIPNTPILKRVKSTDSKRPFTKNCVSLNEILKQKQTKKKTLEEMVISRAESKMLSTKQDLSTMHEMQNPNPSGSYLSKRKILETQKNTGQSEIKNSTQLSGIFERARIRMSHIENPKLRKKNNQLQNSNFSLFQREENVESNELFEDQLINESKNMGRSFRGEEQQKNAEDSSYAYELMREECNFLRNKYIEHAENEHGANF